MKVRFFLGPHIPQSSSGRTSGFEPGERGPNPCWGTLLHFNLINAIIKTLLNNIIYMPYKDRNKKREYQREWCAKRRRDFLDGKSCIECGSTEYLQLDHIDRTKKISHRIWSWTEERRKEEIKKCQILCKICHKKKTKKDLNLK